MRTITILLFALFVGNLQLEAKTGDPVKSHKKWLHRLVLEGTYHGKNLLLENPIDDDKGYCITSIAVNGEEMDGLGRMAQIEINLSDLGFKPGEKIDVVIEHDAACVPTVINPGVLR
jgi:hypothetical protein